MLEQGSWFSTVLMPQPDKFAPIRKGLLEFLILKIVAGGQVYKHYFGSSPLK